MMPNRRKLFENVPESTRAIMRAIRSKETKPEVLVRKALHAMGYRFRLHKKGMPGSPDIVLAKHRTVVFVHGCFWHQHPNCKHAKLPNVRREYWLPKLARTQERDQGAVRELRRLGWRVVTIWECATKNADEIATQLYADLQRE